MLSGSLMYFFLVRAIYLYLCNCIFPSSIEESKAEFLGTHMGKLCPIKSVSFLLEFDLEPLTIKNQLIPPAGL